MKRAILAAVLSLLPVFMVRAQDYWPTNFFALNAAMSADGNTSFYGSTQIWPYLWDIPLSYFDDGFIRVEMRDQDPNADPGLLFIYKESDSIRMYYQAHADSFGHSIVSKPIYFYPTTEGRGELYWTGGLFDNTYIETTGKSKYCRSYSYDQGVLTKNTRGKAYKYVGFDLMGRLSSFSLDGFTSDSIIESGRTIAPDDPWNVTYSTGGRIVKISSEETVIDFSWKIDAVQYKKVTNSFGSKQYEVYGIRFSQKGENGKWTKGVFYEYDVVDNEMTPSHIVTRKFLPNDELAEYRPESSESSETIPFQLVELKPSFQGGDANEFSKWVNSHLVYPEKAKKEGIQGRVTLQFTVESDGSVTNVRVLRGVDPSLDAEAVRVVSSSPKWNPGRQRDRNVRVTYTFPVIFQMR